MWHQRKLFSKCIGSSCLLFFIGILIYDYYQPHFNLYDQLSNENLLIEQALEQIPTCTSGDRSRQRALLYTLQEWTHFAEQHHIRYWIAYGTLVGYVQRHGLLPHDPHIDIFLMAQDTSSLVALSQLYFSSTYTLKVHPQWQLVGQRYRSYYYSQGIDFITPNARFFNSKEDVYINIWPIYDFNPNDNKTETGIATLTSYDRNYQWKSLPIELTFPLQECKFSGMKVWCPAQSERLVADLYGEISVHTSWTTCTNGSWVRSIEYIIAESMMNLSTKS